MDTINEGHGELIGWHDPDENRQWILTNKSRGLEDKRMTVTDAVLDLYADVLINIPPDTPMINGPLNGKNGEEYSYN
jgi:hypothetical protein